MQAPVMSYSGQGGQYGSLGSGLAEGFLGPAFRNKEKRT